MSLNIKIHNFNGPFDLLLHLIKKNKMDIYDIQIYEITNQYLEYLNQMEDLDLEVTSEFIVMASRLIEIKSKYLLPKQEKEDDEEKDPRKELVDKLLEYKKFKAVAEFLKSKQEVSGVCFSKKPEIIEEKKKDPSIKELFQNITMLDLYNTYNKLINNYINKMNVSTDFKGEIYLEKYKIEDKIKLIMDNIKNNSKYEFSNFIDECESKLEVVITFLAILELVKSRIIEVHQSYNFDKIYLERTEKNE
ncbi:segregation/condensation protein A [Clostridium oceanicum]|uniref:Segregation and condensation protein A n=1 Tax=Clostridium oceanicum TaxID=1543 RepID=A0ABP3UXU0_9CLOT